jgi:hypothetical protein
VEDLIIVQAVDLMVVLVEDQAIEIEVEINLSSFHFKNKTLLYIIQTNLIN